MAHRLDILHRLQSRLLEIVGTGLPLITSSIKDADLVGLAHLRGEMVAALMAYARYVDETVMPEALASGDPERLRRAEELKAGCLQLKAAYRGFRRRWAHRDGRTNWPEYRLSAIVMMKQMRDHVRATSARTPAAAAA